MALRHQGIRHVAGYIVVDDLDGKTKIEYDTYQCCHCNAHYTREVGKGPPAMCLLCNQPTCGKKKCDPCKPFERRLEEMEARERLRRQI